ncbi:MAG: DNA-binding protein, partial [Alloprevotella sp.]
MKDLTISQIERQNVLNNHFAIATIQDHLGLEAIFYDNQYWLTKKMVADFYEVEERTIERYIAQNEKELSHNGYVLSKGKTLKEIKLQFAHVINVGSKTTQLGL